MAADIQSEFHFGNISMPERTHSTRVAPQLYYHLTNQTAAGESALFPVATDAVLKDLRIVQWHTDGSCRSVDLVDGDGLRSRTLDTHSVFLESVDNPPPHPFPLEAVCVFGRIEPTVLEVREAVDGPSRIVRVRGDFLIDIVDPDPGAFLTISVTDREGNRYPIGTFGILEAH